eukprot:4442153-Amphidinium_carterae.1
MLRQPFARSARFRHTASLGCLLSQVEYCKRVYQDEVQDKAGAQAGIPLKKTESMAQFILEVNPLLMRSWLAVVRQFG